MTHSRLLSSDGLSLHGGIYKKQLQTLSGRDLGAYLSPLSLIYSFLNCIMLFYTLDTVYFRSQSIFVSSIANLSAIGAIFTFCLTQRDESACLAIEWLWWLRPTECQTTLQTEVKYIKIVLHAKVKHPVLECSFYGGNFLAWYHHMGKALLWGGPFGQWANIECNF